MSDMKTQPTGASVEAFIASVDHAGRREDAAVVLDLMNRVTGTKPRMWGPSIIGYGEYAYERRDGSKHRFLVTGFSPRKAKMVIYLMTGCAGHAEALARLGPHKHSSSCLYLGRLSKIDFGVLEEVIAADIVGMRERYPDLSL